MRGLTTDEARVTEELEKLDGKLDGYERILSKQKYLAGDVRRLIADTHQIYTNLTGIVNHLFRNLPSLTLRISCTDPA